MEPVGRGEFAEEHPQCVSCSKLNLRRRKFALRNKPAVAATTARAAIFCQSICGKILLCSCRATGCFTIGFLTGAKKAGTPRRGVPAITGFAPDDRRAHLTYWQSLADESRIPSPRVAGRGLGRGAVRQRLKSIGPQCAWPLRVLMSCPSLLLSPHQAWRGESDHLSTCPAFGRSPPSQKLRCAHDRPHEKTRLDTARART